MKQNKVLITGGSRGIGKSIVEKFAYAGWDVFFSKKKKKEEADKIIKAMQDKNLNARAIQMDVSNRKSVVDAKSEIETHWGHLDALINNAGINKPTDFDQISDEDWDNILNVNLKGPFIVSQVFFDLLKKSTSASIIHIGSVSGQYGGPRTAHYAASKAGLISLSQVIARFGAKDNIRSNVIAAGLIDTSMSSNALGNAAVNKAAESILLGRMGKTEEVAEACMYLASSSSSYITAQTINVNGGLYF